MKAYRPQLAAATMFLDFHLQQNLRGVANPYYWQILDCCGQRVSENFSDFF
jgi:hypothetical protein